MRFMKLEAKKTLLIAAFALHLVAVVRAAVIEPIFVSVGINGLTLCVTPAAFLDARRMCAMGGMKMARVDQADAQAVARSLFFMRMPMIPGPTGIGMWIEEFSRLRSPSAAGGKGVGKQISLKIFSADKFGPSCDPPEFYQMVLCEPIFDPRIM